MVKFFSIVDSIWLWIVGFFMIVLLASWILKQEKISRANIEIETEDHIYYSLKETIEIKPDLCISFFELTRETKLDHCGRYTVTYLK